jgi:hypothetical protein
VAVPRLPGVHQPATATGKPTSDWFTIMSKGSEEQLQRQALQESLRRLSDSLTDHRVISPFDRVLDALSAAHTACKGSYKLAESSLRAPANARSHRLTHQLRLDLIVGGAHRSIASVCARVERALMSTNEDAHGSFKFCQITTILTKMAVPAVMLCDQLLVVWANAFYESGNPSGSLSDLGSDSDHSSVVAQQEVEWLPCMVAILSVARRLGSVEITSRLSISNACDARRWSCEVSHIIEFDCIVT